MKSASDSAEYARLTTLFKRVPILYGWSGEDELRHFGFDLIYGTYLHEAQSLAASTLSRDDWLALVDELVADFRAGLVQGVLTAFGIELEAR